LNPPPPSPRKVPRVYPEATNADFPGSKSWDSVVNVHLNVHPPWRNVHPYVHPQKALKNGGDLRVRVDVGT
jgi:hypothetical protein